MTDTATARQGRPRPQPGRRTGVVRNRLSRRNRAGGARLDLGDPDILIAEPEELPELGDMLADFARREVGLVVIDGGDGTVREVLSALPLAYGDHLPKVAVLASGTTNLIAADVGAGRADASTVQMLAAIARSGGGEGMIQRRSTLAVEWPDVDRPVVHGMFLGAAAFTRATGISVRLVRQGKIDEGAGVAATLMSALAQTFAGGEREQWLQGEPMRITRAGGASEEGARFVFLATTLQKLVLGIWPFWGEGVEADTGVVRYLDVAAPPKRLVAALPAVMRGRPRKWMAEAGYRSGAAPCLEMSLQEPFVIDGESFEAGPSGSVRIRAGIELEFLVP